VEELLVAFSDGIVLARLLEICYGVKIPVNDRVSITAVRLDNITECMHVINQTGLGEKTSVAARDFFNGHKLKIIAFVLKLKDDFPEEDHYRGSSAPRAHGHLTMPGIVEADNFGDWTQPVKPLPTTHIDARPIAGAGAQTDHERQVAAALDNDVSAVKATYLDDRDLVHTAGPVNSSQASSQDAAMRSQTDPEDPTNWRAVTDGEGRTYYYNRNTRKTQWKQPQGFVGNTSGTTIRTTTRTELDFYCAECNTLLKFPPGGRAVRCAVCNTTSGYCECPSCSHLLAFNVAATAIQCSNCHTYLSVDNFIHKTQM